MRNRSSAVRSPTTPRLTREALLVLRKRYLARNHAGKIIETPIQMFRRIASNIASAEQRYPARTRFPQAARRFYDSMARLDFLPNSPTIMNAGRSLQQLSACFVLPVEDSLPAILNSVKYQALIHQSGGGTGFSFSRLRPHHDIVASTSGVASGPLSFMRIFNLTTDVIKQGGSRRGANMGILRVDHPEILDFIDLKRTRSEMTNFNLSVGLTDAFMQARERNQSYSLINPRTGEPTGRLSARLVFDRLVEAAWESGEPGVVYLDTINRANPTPHLGAIEATNPCVTGDTWVHTTEGPRQVRDLVGIQFTALVNGNSYLTSYEGFFSTGTRPVIEIRTIEGHNLRLTPEHKLSRITKKTRYCTTTEWCKAGDLKPGDLLVLNDHRLAPEWPGMHTYEEGYLLGHLVGDGVLKEDKAILSVWSTAGTGVGVVKTEAFRCASTLPHRRDFKGWIKVADRHESRLSLGSLKSLAIQCGMKPGNKLITSYMEQGSSAFYRGFLRGLFDTDGCVQGNLLKGVSVRLAQSNLARLECVQRMLLRLGILSRLYCNRRLAGSRLLPDGKGSRRHYQIQAQHELVISGSNLTRFYDLIGFADEAKAAKLSDALASYGRQLNRERFIARINTIAPSGTEDVFDVRVPGIHAFDANGFLAHNCGEQPLLPYESCTLGSINVARFLMTSTPQPTIDYDRLSATVSTAVRFLDNVLESNHYPFAEIEAATMRTRKIGLGIMGFADLLIALRIPYDSEEALKMASTVMAFVQSQAHEASRRLATERGTFPAYPGSRLERHHDPRRNATVTTIAPTGTISLIAGCSPGIEPLYAIQTIRTVMEGTQLVTVQPSFLRMARAARLDLKRLQPELDAAPSIRHLSTIPADLRRLFATAHDVTPEQHVRMQAVFQRYSDSGVSKTINLPSTSAKAEVAKAFLLAYELGCKGLTVFRSGSRAQQVLSCAKTQSC